MVCSRLKRLAVRYVHPIQHWLAKSSIHSVTQRSNNVQYLKSLARHFTHRTRRVVVSTQDVTAPCTVQWIYLSTLRATSFTCRCDVSHRNNAARRRRRRRWRAAQSLKLTSDESDAVRIDCSVLPVYTLYFPTGFVQWLTEASTANQLLLQYTLNDWKI